jgi:hypothetical protein
LRILGRRVVVVERAGEEALTNVRGHRDVVAEHDVPLVGRGLRAKHSRRQLLQSTNAGLRLRARGTAGRRRGTPALSTDIAASLPELGDCADEVEAPDAVLPVVAEVVEEDQRSVRPAAEHRVFQLERADHRIEVIGPQPGVP